MSETEKKKDEIIKDGVSRAIKNSEIIAVQAVDSAAKVLKVGLDNAEELTAKAGDILLNTARKAINAGNIVAGDVREATRNMAKGSIDAASEIGGEVKKMASGVIGKSATAEKPEKEAKSE